MKIPKIIIKYNHLIDPIFVFYCKNSPELKKLGWNNWTPPSEEEILKKVKEYKKIWKKYEAKIIKGISRITGLKFKTDKIEIHIVKGTPRAISNPLIISGTLSKDDFIETLSHELIHRLFSLNVLGKKVFFSSKKYKNLSSTTKKHIYVFAILEKLFKEILKEPQRIANLKQKAQKHSTDEYRLAWEIIEREGYEKIINNLTKKIKICS